MKHVLGLLFLAAILATAAHAQTRLPNEIYQTFGYPCSYDTGATQNMGNIGCWMQCYCVNGKVFTVSWYQWWACSPGNSVDGMGGLSYLQEWDMVQQRAFNEGGQAWGAANILVAPLTGGFTFSFEAGWDSNWCDRLPSTSEPYNFFC